MSRILFMTKSYKIELRQTLLFTCPSHKIYKHRKYKQQQNKLSKDKLSASLIISKF